MDRRRFLRSASAISTLSMGCSQHLLTSAKRAAQPVRRVRPGDPSWPSNASWDGLRREVGGRLIKIESPLAECRAAPETTACAEIFKQLTSPYRIGDNPALFAGLPGHEPDLMAARRDAGAINRAMHELMKVVTNPGSYVSESNFFEGDWQDAFWGANYARLLAVKERYDPDGLFFVHHGVGSERWSDDGFERLVRG